MVDLSNVKNRCILHVEGDLNDGDYIELTTDYDFSDKGELGDLDQFYIAIYNFLMKAKIDDIYLTDLEEDEAVLDFGDEDDDDDYNPEDCIANALDEVMYTTFIESGLSKENAAELVEMSYYYLPRYDCEKVHTITDVKLYKFDNKEFYYYDNGWKKVF